MLIAILAIAVSPGCVMMRRSAATLPSPPPQLQDASDWTVPVRSFDLMWKPASQVDANGLPLNPIWAYQRYNPGKRPDFYATCKDAFRFGREIIPKRLRDHCSSQGLTLDTSKSPLDLFGFCHAKPIRGHVNWGLVTYTGKIEWEEWETDGTLRDSDYNFGLYPADNAGLTNLGEGLGLEFRAEETINEFKSPWWSALHKAVQEKPYNLAEAHRMIDDRPAIVTGLFGVDGVHGGYTESHPVFSLAIRTSEPQSVADETWAFFIRNSGGEGNCASLRHHWDGLDGIYYLQLPWPAGATDVTYSDASQVWSYQDYDLAAPVLEKKPGWTYLKFTPGPSRKPFVVHGEIALRYVFPAGLPAPPPPPLNVTSRKSEPALRKAHPEEPGGLEEVRKRLGAKAYQQTIATMKSIVPPQPPPRLPGEPKHEPTELKPNRNFADYHDRPSPGKSGKLTQDRTVEDTVKAAENKNAAAGLKSAGK